MKYDLNGHFQYAWGLFGDFTNGGFWGAHQIAVDQEGNVYVANVSGRVQKFRPRQGANAAYLVGKPVYSAWQ